MRLSLVTGGSRGIGRAIVERFASEGDRVYFTYRSREDEAARVADATGATPLPLSLDDPRGPQSVFDRLIQDAGRPDVVVHGAAVDNGFRDVAEVTDAELNHLVNGNVMGGFRVLQLAARHVDDGGRIIAISSLDTARVSRGAALYAATKAAVEALAAGLAQEVGARGVTVNSISPGAVDTERLRSARSPVELAGAARVTPLGRLGRPRDIADVVAFLASPAGGWITGQNIRATGGL